MTMSVTSGFEWADQLRDAFGIERVLAKRRLVKHDQRALQKHGNSRVRRRFCPSESDAASVRQVGQTKMRQCACDVLHAELGQFFSHCVKEKWLSGC